MSAYWDLGWGLISHGAHDGGMHWIDVAFGAWILGMPVLLVVVALIMALDMVRDFRARVAREKALAMRRHPSARPVMSEREARYHGSDQIGR